VRAGRSGISGANLGLYSITFVNDLDQDCEALLWVRSFAKKRSGKGSAYWIFDPNIDSGIAREKLGEFIKTTFFARWPACPRRAMIFLKIVYHGPKAMEELASMIRISWSAFWAAARDHVRRLQADSRSAEVRRARGAVRPQNQ
jgi:hypothetical protein